MEVKSKGFICEIIKFNVTRSFVNLYYTNKHHKRNKFLCNGGRGAPGLSAVSALQHKYRTILTTKE